MYVYLSIHSLFYQSHTLVTNRKKNCSHTEFTMSPVKISVYDRKGQKSIDENDIVEEVSQKKQHLDTLCFSE